MKMVYKALVISGLLICVGAIFYAFRSRLNKSPAGLEISTTPTATVYIDGKNVGKTPYSDKNLNSGTYTVRLEPDPIDGTVLSSWETKVTLTPLVSTAITRTFAAAEADAVGSILYMEKEPGGSTYISVISEPDTINITIDGKPFGFTPVTKIDVTPGSHTIVFASPGYKTQEMSINALQGYNLIARIKLASDAIVLATPSPTVVPTSESATPSASLSPSPLASVIAVPYVVVQETGTGWLRVRREPSATGEEIGKANTAEKLPYLGETTESGWHKVTFEGHVGWVSGRYVELVK